VVQAGPLRFCKEHGIVPIAHSALGGADSDFDALASDPAAVAALALARGDPSASVPASSGLPSPYSEPVTLPQLLVQWALRRGCGVVISSRSPAHQRELLASMAVPMTAPSAAMVALSNIPTARYRRRVLPAAFAFLFSDG